MARVMEYAFIGFPFIQAMLFFLPAGRVHAIGAGSLLIEIQQNSDTTYRAFDWNRIDTATGTKRDLHVEQAIQCIDFGDVQPATDPIARRLAD